jgi:molybdopterin/thiamine biosynthesis adenylyltransferase
MIPAKGNSRLAEPGTSSLVGAELLEFDRDEAFSRNIGWITRDEHRMLAEKVVAIAGMGGVGGVHLTTLVRMGVGSFRIADLDRYELANLNRQRGASMSRLGREKVEVMREIALDINPTLQVRAFRKGVDRSNVDEFLDGADLYLDGIDFFAIDVRRLLFGACAEKGIPAVTAAPLGMGCSLMSFLPGKMTFERYFRLNGRPRSEQLIRFLVGLTPAHLHSSYLVDPTSISFEEERGPSTPMGVALCAGMAVTESLKILLGRGKVLCAPHGIHFDAYRNRFRHTWRPGGNGNPWHRLMLALAVRKFSAGGGAISGPQSPGTAPR